MNCTKFIAIGFLAGGMTLSGVGDCPAQEQRPGNRFGRRPQAEQQVPPETAPGGQRGPRGRFAGRPEDGFGPEAPGPQGGFGQAPGDRPMMGRPGDFGGRGAMGGFPLPPGAGAYGMGPGFEKIFRLGSEVQRLRMEEEMLEQDSQNEPDDADAKTNRQNEIEKLRKKLLDLEKSEVLDQMRKSAPEIQDRLAEIRSRINERAGSAPGGRIEPMLDRLSAMETMLTGLPEDDGAAWEKLVEWNESQRFGDRTGFGNRRGRMDLGGFAPPPGQSGAPNDRQIDRIQREIEALGNRQEKLLRELETLRSGASSTGVSPMPPLPGME